MEREALRVSDVVGRRALVKMKNAGYGYRGDDVVEVKFVETSPAGQWVKMEKDGHRFWRAVSDVALVELLTELRPKEPKPDATS